jgi:hypothetical protein
MTSPTMGPTDIRYCKACRYPLVRRERQGVFHRHFLSLFGFYPWRCPSCSLRYYLRQRTAGRSEKPPA